MNEIIEYLWKIYIFLSVNSFIVLLDQLIEISKSDQFNKEKIDDIQLNNDEIKTISSIGISLLTLLIEIIILIILKKLTIFIIIAFLISTTISFIKHYRIKKTKIFIINHLIFDLALLVKFFMFYITIKFLIE